MEKTPKQQLVALPEQNNSDQDFGELPEYAQSLLSFHRAHALTLRQIAQTLGVRPGDRVADIATGDGTYAILLAELGAQVTAIDVNPAFLKFAQKRAAEHHITVTCQEAKAQALPFKTGTFDGAFCAQSFYSITDVQGVMAEMVRVVRPGGWVAVMENDSLHHLILPWPPELELQLLEAEYRALRSEEKNEQRYYIGRRLTQVLKDAGLVNVTKKSFATQYNAPLSADERQYLEHHLSTVVERARPHLATDAREQIESLTSTSSSTYLLDSPDFSATVIDFLVGGRVVCADAPE